MVMVQVDDMEVSGEVGNTFYFVAFNSLGATFEVVPRRDTRSDEAPQDGR